MAVTTFTAWVWSSREVDGVLPPPQPESKSPLGSGGGASGLHFRVAGFGGQTATFSWRPFTQMASAAPTELSLFLPKSHQRLWRRCSIAVSNPGGPSLNPGQSRADCFWVNAFGLSASGGSVGVGCLTDGGEQLGTFLPQNPFGLPPHTQTKPTPKGIFQCRCCWRPMSPLQGCRLFRGQQALFKATAFLAVSTSKKPNFLKISSI